MSRRDKTSFKDTLVLDPIVEVEEIEEFEATPQPAVLSEKEALLKKEREKCDSMSKDELVEYLLRTKENLWSSHDERDSLEVKLGDKGKEIEDLRKTDRDNSQKISNLERDKRDLEEELKKSEDEKANLNIKIGEVDQLKKQIEDLEESLQNKEKAAKDTQLNLEKFNKAEIEKLNEDHEAEINKLTEDRDAKLDKCKERIKKLESDLKEVKADNKKLKADLEKAQDSADYFKKSFGVARDANFAGMIVRDIPKEIGLGFETVDEKVKDMFETLMTDVRDLYLSTASGVIKAADDKISNQETAAVQLKKAEKDLQDSEDLSRLADQRREEARKRVEEAERNFIEAKGEEA